MPDTAVVAPQERCDKAALQGRGRYRVLMARMRGGDPGNIPDHEAEAEMVTVESGFAALGESRRKSSSSATGSSS